MNEASYLSAFSDELEKAEGGKVIKISDRSTLGLPDSFHIKDGIVTYFEGKIGTDYDFIGDHPSVFPWQIVKKDLRQFEVCRSMARNALVVYCIYWTTLKMSAVLPVQKIMSMRSLKGQPLQRLDRSFLYPGHGVPQLQNLMHLQRRELYEKFKHVYGTDGEIIP